MRISDWSSDVCSSDLDDSDRTESARDFPPADRPVAPTVSTKWSTEEARDRVNEAEDVMDSADVRPGMTVADIGAGDGYYPVRLAQRVGANRSEEHTSELQSLMRISYAVYCLKKKQTKTSI